MLIFFVLSGPQIQFIGKIQLERANIFILKDGTSPFVFTFLPITYDVNWQSCCNSTVLLVLELLLT